MKTGPTCIDSKDSIVINNQCIDKRFKNLHILLSLEDNVHSNQDCKSSAKPHLTGNVSNSIDSLKNQVITEHKELIEVKDRKSQWQRSLDDNHNLPNVSRRSSESFSENFQRFFTSDGRRFSDSATQSDESCESMILNRRRSFRRQARIRSEQFESFDESFDSNEMAENDTSLEASRAQVVNTENNAVRNDRPSSLQMVTNIRDRVCEKVSEMEETLNMELDEDRHSGTDNTSRILDEDDVNEEETEDNLCCSENRDLCCQSDKLGQICKHDENHTACCYHESSERCWRKMEKIMQKNKKLENMVVKSKKGMAEIREMLSSVVSVRMEPGF